MVTATHNMAPEKQARRDASAVPRALLLLLQPPLLSSRHSPGRGSPPVILTGGKRLSPDPQGSQRCDKHGASGARMPKHRGASSPREAEAPRAPGRGDPTAGHRHVPPRRRDLPRLG